MRADLRLDHVVILVRDLDVAIAEWTELGFTVVRGGAHEGIPTHNALIALADGSYLELFARRPGMESAPPGPAVRILRREPDEGLADFALFGDDLAATVTAARGHGLSIDGPAAMGRTRPDGQQIAWELGFPAYDLPFLIRDVTPRALRVPGGHAIEHANGATGVAQLAIAVRDLGTGVARYRALLGVEPDPGEVETATQREQRFSLGSMILSLVMSLDEISPDSRIARHGDGPERLILRSHKQADTRLLKHSIMLIPSD